MQRFITAVAAVILLAAAGCGGSTGPDTTGGPEVQVGDNFYNPSTLTVTAGANGATVTWRWVGSASHSVTFDNNGPSSNIQPSGTYTHTFSPGTYTYYCVVHGRNVMSGTLIVR